MKSSNFSEKWSIYFLLLEYSPNAQRCHNFSMIRQAHAQWFSKLEIYFFAIRLHEKNVPLLGASSLQHEVAGSVCWLHWYYTNCIRHVVRHDRKCSNM
ncbi:hypothetical protein Leryth_027119 [Lithospermum erythrorhizon]|nr:hypothetical protein Leryth_027119 [Lithospermum erythrorhizon]